MASFSDSALHKNVVPVAHFATQGGRAWGRKSSCDKGKGEGEWGGWALTLMRFHTYILSTHVLYPFLLRLETFGTEQGWCSVPEPVESVLTLSLKVE